MQTGNAFVYAVTGNAHIEQVNRSLRFLKHFSRQEIVVVASRSDLPIGHDQIVRAEVPEEFNNHQASILLKTGLHRQLDLGGKTWCYLDSDIFAVHPDVDRIFSFKTGPIAFAADHTRMANFSRFAVRCACIGGNCDHLREAIESKFGIQVADPDFQHWNGGVFVFDAQSTEFLDTWHRFTLEIMNDPAWKTRDQGTLIATVWHHGLQNLPTLPRRFNTIVDGMKGLDDHQRAAADPTTYYRDRTYSMRAHDPNSVALLHLIGNNCKPGWRVWDEVLAKLEPTSAEPQQVAGDAVVYNDGYMKIGIVGHGVVGSAMDRLFRGRTDYGIALYDKFKPEMNSEQHKEAINHCDLVFLSVPTPVAADGISCDLSAVEECVSWIEPPICIRSTIAPGTCDRLSAEAGKTIGFSPEYLGESSTHPWPEEGMCGFMIVGGPESLIDLVEEAYKPTLHPDTKIYRTDARTAEVCKYMENCFLATKVAFVNQFYDIASTLGVSYDELRTLWLADPRVGESHTLVTWERGFRGRCLPKDISAMIATMQPHGGAPLLEAVRAYNNTVCEAADRRKHDPDQEG